MPQFTLVKMLLPNFRLVDMVPEKIQPNIFVYKHDTHLESNLTPFNNLEFPIILQSATWSTSLPSDSSGAEHEAVGNIDAESCGRIETCFTEMVNRQHRTHSFLIFFEDHVVRFSMKQRNGTVFSAPFSFRTNPHPLLEFLWRFSNMTDSELRGHDPTVRLATGTTADADAFSEALYVIDPFVVLRAPEQANDGKPHREVVAWGSFALPQSLYGRATRVMSVYDLATKTLALLKDMWRSVEDDKESEVGILRAVQRAQVRNIPNLICGSDIPGQTISLHQYRNASRIDSGPDEFGRTPRRYTLFLTEATAVSLHKFTSSKQMFRAIADAFVGKSLKDLLHYCVLIPSLYTLAHEDAYVKLGFIHRDVSINNIAISKDGGGILYDWDMALPTNRPSTVIRPFPQHTVSSIMKYIAVCLFNVPHSQGNMDIYVNKACRES
jgi:hypothetical protein